MPHSLRGPGGSPICGSPNIKTGMPTTNRHQKKKPDHRRSPRLRQLSIFEFEEYKSRFKLCNRAYQLNLVVTILRRRGGAAPIASWRPN